MKAAQIKKYSKEIKVSVNEIPISVPNANEILVKVKAAAVNPLEILQNRKRKVDTGLQEAFHAGK